MDQKVVSAVDIHNVLTCIDVHKVISHDGINNRLLKEERGIAQLLTHPPLMLQTLVQIPVGA